MGNNKSGKEILRIDKLSHFFPEIFQNIANDYNIKEIKEGDIVKYRAGECKCVITQISTDIITINDNSHCAFAERKIKVSEFKEKLQIVKFLKGQTQWELGEITSYETVKMNDYVISVNGELWKVQYRLTYDIEDIRIGIKDKNNNFKEIFGDQLIKDYKKVLNVEFE